MPTKYTTPMEPPLPLEEHERLKRGHVNWRPQRALHYAWARVDPIHGRGGSYHMGRPSRPTDPGYGDGWTWAGFSAALEQDRKEVEDVVAAFPTHGPRLRPWLQQIEALGRLRTGETDWNHTGEYDEALHALGYRSCL